MASRWYRTQRRLERSGFARASPRVCDVASFYADIDCHLTGTWLRSEVQACGIRLYLMYREVEEGFGCGGRLEDFSVVVCEDPRTVFNWLRGSRGVKRYTIDLLHSWAVLLSCHWRARGLGVSILCHPTGLLEPLIGEVGLYIESSLASETSSTASVVCPPSGDSDK